MTVPILITMQGQLPTPPYSIVVWNVYNTPDNTGAMSGYGAGVLMNIGVTAVSAVGSPVNPLTLDVGGDLTGSLPNPSVSGIQGQSVSATAPTAGQYLRFNGTAWVPVAPAAILYVGLKIEGAAAFIYNYNTPIAPTVVYASLGSYLVTVPGIAIAEGAAWANYAAVSGDPSGYLAAAFPEALGPPAQVGVTVWNGSGGAGSPGPGDPANPDDIVTLFFSG